jgi:methylmalonyl-CoA mutase
MSTSLPAELTLAEWFPQPDMQQWHAVLAKELKGASYEKLRRPTPEGLFLEPLYTTFPGAETPHYPGFAPYLRGTRATGYLERGWELAQELPALPLRDWSTLLYQALEQGQNAVSIPLWGPHALKFQRSNDLAFALQGVKPGAHPIHLAAASTVLLHAQHLVGWAGSAELSGSCTADPLGALAAGEATLDLPEAWDQLTQTLDIIEVKQPALKGIGISTRPYVEAGAHPVQELSFALASAVESLRELQQREQDPAALCGRVRFSLGVGPQLFMEIAKFRAMRVLWARVAQVWGADAEGQKANIHAFTSRYGLTAYDAHNNLLRTCTAAFSALIGGVDSLHTEPFDAIFRTPDAFSVRLARNIQLLLREESHLQHMIDPAGGSAYVETLTRQLAESAWQAFQALEAEGGMGAALAKGLPQTQVQATDAERRTALRKRKSSLVGTNRYANPKETFSGPWPGDLPAPEARFGVTPLVARRLAFEFEQLRARVEHHTEALSILLLPFGELSTYKARADFAQGFLEIAGLPVVCPPAFSDPAMALLAVTEAAPKAVVICGADADYPTWVPALCDGLKGLSEPPEIILAGYPADQVDAYRASGVQHFIHLGADALATLTSARIQTAALEAWGACARW